jgi:hypothetical protein
MATPKPTAKATTKATAKPTVKPKVTPKVTPKPTTSKTKAPSVMDDLIKAGVKKLSPSQKAQLAKLLGIQYKPEKPQPKGTYDPKRWEGVVGDKGW